MNRKLYLILRFALIVFVLWQVFNCTPLSLFAQTQQRWSVARRIPGYADDANPPYLVADQNRTVHAFVSQWTGSELAVFYNRWTPESSWSRPIDILLSPNSHQAIVIGTFLDSKGMMHVAFFGGNAQGAEIYYSQAPAVNAGQASAWLSPELVGAQATSPVAGMLTGDGKDNLYILYSGNLDGNGLYAIKSSDGGNSWSAPETVFLTDSTSLWVAPIQGALDSQGRLHVMWTVVSKAGNGQAVYYARLEADHQHWSRPLTLQTVKGNDYEADWASIIPYNNELFVIYNYGLPPHRWMRRSSDGGKTWTDPVIAFDSKGEYGYPFLLIDSSNRLQVLFGNRTSDDSLYGMWYNTWLGGHWDVGVPIVSGPLTPDFAPTQPRAVISQGNVLLVTWRTDPGPTQNTNGIWYSYTSLDAPETPLQPLPNPTLVSAPTETPPTLPDSTATPTRKAPASPVSSSAPIPVDDSPILPLALAVVPVLLLVLGVIVVSLGLRR